MYKVVRCVVYTSILVNSNIFIQFAEASPSKETYILSTPTISKPLYLTVTDWLVDAASLTQPDSAKTCTVVESAENTRLARLVVSCFSFLSVHSRYVLLINLERKLSSWSLVLVRKKNTGVQRVLTVVLLKKRLLDCLRCFVCNLISLSVSRRAARPALYRTSFTDSILQ